MFRHAHIHHLAADPAGAIEWYTHVFGASEIERHDIRGGEAVRLDIGGVNIIVQEKQPDAEWAPAPPSPAHGADHFCFRVDDIEAAAEHLRERGATIYDGPDEVHIEIIMRPGR